VLERREEGPVIVLSCNEDITAENFEDFRSEYKSFIATLGKNDRMILNLGPIERIASAALGLIAASYPDVVAQGAQMRVVAQSEEVLRLLNVTRLSRVIRVDADLASALQALR